MVREVNKDQKYGKKEGNNAMVRQMRRIARNKHTRDYKTGTQRLEH